MQYYKALISVIAALFMSSVLVAADSQAPSGGVQPAARAQAATAAHPFTLVNDGPTYQTQNYHSGQITEMKTARVTVPFSGSDFSTASPAAFAEQMQLSHERMMAVSSPKTVGGTALSGLNIVFVCDGTVPSAAVTALEVAATYIEGLFTDPVTVTIPIDFATLGSGILGGTSVYYTSTPPSWETTRDGLIAGMDADDYIQAYVPSGSTIPVRYDGSSSTVTDEDQCYFAWADYGAAIGTISGYSAEITFSDQISWDYDPADGVPGDRMCFQSVVIHEVGHALGFVSRAESWYEPNEDIECMDIYRFQRTDGTGDYNPDDVSEFQVRPRLVDYNNPNDDHNSNLFTSTGTDLEYRMSDGTPYQASHFRQTSVAAIMQPAIGYGQTYYPNFYRTPDTDMLDAIGWDYMPNTAPSAASGPMPADSSTGIQVSATLNWTASDPDPGDVLSYDVYFGTSSNPPLVVSKQSAATYVPPSALSYYTQYYWKIVTWDNHLASATGPIWRFKTAPMCGDADGNLAVNISDAVYLIAYIFSGALPPYPLEAGDANCNGAVNISDAVYLITYIFAGGQPPCADCD